MVKLRRKIFLGRKSQSSSSLLSISGEKPYFDQSEEMWYPFRDTPPSLTDNLIAAPAAESPGDSYTIISTEGRESELPAKGLRDVGEILPTVLSSIDLGIYSINEIEAPTANDTSDIQREEIIGEGMSGLFEPGIADDEAIVFTSTDAPNTPRTPPSPSSSLSEPSTPLSVSTTPATPSSVSTTPSSSPPAKLVAPSTPPSPSPLRKSNNPYNKLLSNNPYNKLLPQASESTDLLANVTPLGSIFVNQNSDRLRGRQHTRTPQDEIAALRDRIRAAQPNLSDEFHRQISTSRQASRRGHKRSNATVAAKPNLRARTPLRLPSIPESHDPEEPTFHTPASRATELQTPRSHLTAPSISTRSIRFAEPEIVQTSPASDESEPDPIKDHLIFPTYLTELGRWTKEVLDEYQSHAGFRELLHSSHVLEWRRYRENRTFVAARYNNEYIVVKVLTNTGAIHHLQFDRLTHPKDRELWRRKDDRWLDWVREENPLMKMSLPVPAESGESPWELDKRLIWGCWTPYDHIVRLPNWPTKDLVRETQVYFLTPHQPDLLDLLVAARMLHLDISFNLCKRQDHWFTKMLSRTLNQKFDMNDMLITSDKDKYDKMFNPIKAEWERSTRVSEIRHQKVLQLRKRCDAYRRKIKHADFDNALDGDDSGLDTEIDDGGKETGNGTAIEYLKRATVKFTKKPRKLQKPRKKA